MSAGICRRTNESRSIVKGLNIQILFLLGLCAVLAASVEAQVRRGGSPNDPMAKSIRDKMVEMRIKEEKKEFDRLVKRSEEAAKLSEEIQTSFSKNKRLTSADKKKLARLESLMKKIRRELRAGKSEEKRAPVSKYLAVKRLQESTSTLFSAIKKTTRHSISVVAIETSHTVLKLVKFLRFGK